jgi:hypothetical protein
MPGRRAFLERALLGGLLTFSGGPLHASAQTTVLGVLQQAIDLGRQLRRGEITPLDWQDAIGPTLRGCAIDELRDTLALDRLRAHAPTLRRGASILRVPLFDTLDADEGAAMRVFFFEADCGDPPHVHFNQVTSHIVLEGRFRVRHFERLREEPGGFVLRPSHDRVIEVGDSTSISDLRDNGHWHHALTRGVLLDVEQGRLDPSIPIRRRQMIDPGGPVLADGSILAPRLTRSAALRLYG